MVAFHGVRVGLKEGQEAGHRCGETPNLVPVGSQARNGLFGERACCPKRVRIRQLPFIGFH